MADAVESLALQLRCRRHSADECGEYRRDEERISPAGSVNDLASLVAIHNLPFGFIDQHWREALAPAADALGLLWDIAADVLGLFSLLRCVDCTGREQNRCQFAIRR
jgi:hypothetical protein